MNYVLERVTQPEIEAVTLAEMKRHLREFTTISAEAEAEIEGLIQSAREWVEGETGRTLIDTTWRMTVGDFSPPASTSTTITGSLPAPQEGIILRMSPVLSVVSVASVDSDGMETAIDADTYLLLAPDSKWPRLTGLEAATTLRIVYRAGFADQTGSPQTGAEVVPMRFKQAMKLWAEAMYDRDEKLMPLLLEAACAVIKDERANLQFA